jgi:hypothetical protein
MDACFDGIYIQNESLHALCACAHVNVHVVVHVFSEKPLNVFEMLHTMYLRNLQPLQQ